MDMVYDIDEVDIQQLKSRYLIPEGTKELYKQDLEFVIEYRERLAEALSYFASGNIDTEMGDVGIEKVLDLASSLEAYMKSTLPANVMRKLRFINNINEEVDFAVRYIKVNSNEEYNSQLSKVAKDVSDFLTYVAGNALLLDNLLERLEDETAKIACERLKNELKRNLPAHINENEIHYNDLFFALAHCLYQAQNLADDYKDYYSEYCENCERDCSYPTVCGIARTRDKKYDSMNAYEHLRDMFLNRIYKDLVVDVNTVSRETSKITKGRFVNACETLLTTPNIENLGYRPKNICLDWGEAKNVCLDELKIKINLYKSLSLGKGIDYNNLDDVLAYILLNEVDFSLTTGQKEHNRFMAENIGLREKANKECASGMVRKASYHDLIARYQGKTSINENSFEQAKGD